MAENEVSNIIGAEPRELDLLPDVLYNKSSSFHVEQDRIRKLAESFIKSAATFILRVEKKTAKKDF